MKIFNAYKTIVMCSGYVEEFDVDEIVIANTKDEALGFILTRHKHTKSSDWSITEVDTSKAGVWDGDEPMRNT